MKEKLPRNYVIKTGWKYWFQCQEELFKLGKAWVATGNSLYEPLIVESQKKYLIIHINGDYLTYSSASFIDEDAENIFTYKEWAKKAGIIKCFNLE